MREGERARGRSRKEGIDWQPLLSLGMGWSGDRPVKGRQEENRSVGWGREERGQLSNGQEERRLVKCMISGWVRKGGVQREKRINDGGGKNGLNELGAWKGMHRRRKGDRGRDSSIGSLYFRSRYPQVQLFSPRFGRSHCFTICPSDAAATCGFLFLQFVFSLSCLQ